MKKEICFSPADILLPHCELEKWAVIACDQYTSEPEYWDRAYKIAGNAPSALKIILPEAQLKEDNSAAVAKINDTMKKYLDENLFYEYKNSIFYVERTQSDGCVRRGIIGKIDLKEYDYTGKAAEAQVRATEKTVVERIPPRVKIRENATLEMPHVMLLIDDPDFSVIEPLSRKKQDFEKLYDFDLMLGGGHIKGYRTDSTSANDIIASLEKVYEKCNGLLFCVGDGNHSLAAAKASYEQSPNEKNRYALVEVVNIHDPALQFEPIYRVVCGVEPKSFVQEFADYCGGETADGGALHYKCLFAGGEKDISVSPVQKSAVGALQSFLNEYTVTHSGVSVDYIHGVQSLKKLSKRENAVGFIFDGINKSELFPAVLADGSLPRKSFSMGHADDKRFYIEARLIK